MRSPARLTALTAALLFAVPAKADPDAVCIRYCDIPTQANPAQTGPPPPSAEERRRQLDAADLQEAADDAQDRGQAALARGEVAAAARLFEEAAGYAPADVDIAQNLARARQRLTEINGPAARQATAAASGQAEAVFDGRAPMRDVGGITVSPSGSGGDPVVPAARRTKAIAALESQRSAQRARIAEIDRELGTLDRNADSTRIVSRRRERDRIQSQVDVINLSIGEALRLAPPAAAPPRK